MPDSPITIPADLRRDLTIQAIRSTIVDVPTVRRHKLSSLSVTAQSYVIVEVRLANGAEGIGEAATLGGPRWSEESVEAIKANIDAHLAPALIGHQADRFEATGVLLDSAAKRNNAAKAAIDTALFDAVGRTLGVPAHQLLGGLVRDSLPVLWTLASGDPAQEIEEAEAKLAARLHDTFKVKIGALSPDADLARMRRLTTALAGRARFIVDANQAWDETTANRCLPMLAELGVTLVEQPLPAWNVAGMARVRARSAVPLMADECVFSTHDMLGVAQAAAADVVSLKLVKHAGLLNLHKVAAVAEAAGIGLYGGCLLESSIGAAAHLQAFAGLRELAWGCEHFGPQILTDDLVEEPLRFEDFRVHLPAGPGIGVTLDRDKLRRYARA
ncbi:muconate/chloromuconate family cycloisomerase [Falsiroseomonas stagni]|uniref:Muconate cycloisomerase n=1 Tax=Falsiroseomonas stagni DSM 19981 TaxID=1123062 RepID=A0A1I4F843_9PROT|nr:muconate/chloromuconate family cycloisomerase [Falsiroseomonas stagni]SFL13027.1 muconate cycloisomerase [Falsiroseomonas stagni DSM 19981]